nr:DNA mismatch repair protein [Farysia itapuensis]
MRRLLVTASPSSLNALPLESLSLEAMDYFDSRPVEDAHDHPADNDRFDCLNSEDFPRQNQMTALALEVFQGKLGCAVYDGGEHALFLWEDQPFEVELADTEDGAEGAEEFDSAPPPLPASSRLSSSRSDSVGLLESPGSNSGFFTLRGRTTVEVARLCLCVKINALDSAQELAEIRLRIAELAKMPQLCFLLNMGVGSVYTWERLFKKIQLLLSQMRLDSSEVLSSVKYKLTADDLEPLTGDISRIVNRLGRKVSSIADSTQSRRRSSAHANFAMAKAKAESQSNLGWMSILIRYEPVMLACQIFWTASQEKFDRNQPSWPLSIIPGGETVDMLADESLEQQFSSETKYVVLFAGTNKYNQLLKLGDLSSFIIDREIEILDELHNKLVEYRPQLIRAHNIIMELDWLAVSDELARKVPNDIELWGGYGLQPSRLSDNETASGTKKSVMVLTGANSSGKSCLLQQAALAVFMSQCGCFVPAAEAELGVFDKILTRIRHDESVASEGSSFTRELARLNRAISCSTSKSLVLLDEMVPDCSLRPFTTSWSEAKSVRWFCQLLIIFVCIAVNSKEDTDRLSLRESLSTGAITAHLPPTLPIYQGHMQTVFLPGVDATSNLTYLYRLCPGFAGTSHASHCALLCGVPDAVVNRAVQITQTGIKSWQDAPANQDEAVVRRLLQLDFEQVQKQRDGASGQQLLEWIVFGNETEL